MISIIIPVRNGGNPYTTLRSLAGHRLNHDMEIVIAWDEAGAGANAARNKGAALARGEFLLFSDDDIRWHPDGIERLFASLVEHEDCAFSYGAYRMGERIHCAQRFDVESLKRNNFISTMSLIRREAFPGFDPAIRRLQDWDLWLTMVEQGRRGVYCGSVIFETEVRAGITFGDVTTWEEAREVVARKHGLV